MREWDIPYDELKIGEPIGTGRFGTVYRGNWHGDVAIKVLNMDYYLDDDKTLEAFKLEVRMQSIKEIMLNYYLKLLMKKLEIFYLDYYFN
jgi:serine/threonine protein kinase